MSRWLAGPATAALLLASLPAQADVNEELILDVAADALFHLDVTGELKGAPGVPETRHGKAFAVAPNILLTSSHVIGDYEEWRVLTDRQLNGQVLNAAIRRAARPIHRVLRVTGQNVLESGTDQVIPHSTPFKSVDAASLTVSQRELSLGNYFSLSLCPITPDTDYFTLMTTSNTPQDAGSVEADALKVFKLTSVGYNPPEFGSLYAFTIENENPKAKIQEWGHAGSPIFDADGNVVAFVSAFIRHSGDEKILATPIQPIVPGTSRVLASAPVSLGNSALSCSLANAVKEISDDVTSHAEWSINVPRDRDGKVKGDILLSYRGVSAAPIVESIEVQYEFKGKARREAPRPTTLPLVGGATGLDDPIPPTSDDERRFELSHLFFEGTKIEADPKLRERGGKISTVTLFVFPILRNERPGRPAEFEFSWIEEDD